MLKRLLMLLVGVQFLLAWGGCSDNPEDSGNPDDTTPDSVVQYRVYGLDRDVNSCDLLVLKTSSETPEIMYDLAAGYDGIYRAPDGRVLLANSFVDSTSVLTIDSVVTDIPITGAGIYHFDPNRGYHLRVTASAVYRLSAQSLAPIDSFAASLSGTKIDTANRLLYGTDKTGISPAVVYRYNYSTGVLQDSIVMTDSVGQPIEVGPLLPVPAYNRLYFLGRPEDGTLRAYVYDLVNHRILSGTMHEGLPGQLVATSDGRTVYRSEPSNTGGGECRIWYHDVASNTIRGHMTAEVVLTGGHHDTVQVYDMHITPDDRYLYATGSQSGYLLVFDLSTHTLVSATSPFILGMPPLIALGDELP
jgi:DNA-binding beta-propeller fold protein YncE